MRAKSHVNVSKAGKYRNWRLFEAFHPKSKGNSPFRWPHLALMIAFYPSSASNEDKTLNE